jgi:hypothetical protein
MSDDFVIGVGGRRYFSGFIGGGFDEGIYILVSGCFFFHVVKCDKLCLFSIGAVGGGWRCVIAGLSFELVVVVVVGDIKFNTFSRWLVVLLLLLL